MENIKIGQYEVIEDDFAFCYLVYKIMAKTAEVNCLLSYKGSDYENKEGRHYRYPLSLLKDQIKDARYTSFKKF